MRPGHIKVFDGLRITTEHVNHLQGAMHSALQEIRGILGLGQVYQGFEVSADDSGSITISPGLAFDGQGNRLVCDEPKTLPVSFGPGEKDKFVCLKYDQIEDGQVEGQFTIIWDSCAPILRSAPPDPKDNLIPIAKLSKGDQTRNGALKIVSLISTGPDSSNSSESGDSSEGAAETTPAGVAQRGSESGEAVEQRDMAAATAQEPAQTSRPGRGIAVQSAANGQPDSVAGGISKATEPETPAASTAPAMTAPEAARFTTQVWQGVARLTGEDESGSYLNNILLGPLKRKLAGGETVKGAENKEVEMMFTLAEQEIVLDAPVSGVSYQTIINAELRWAGAASVAEAPPPSAKCQATARGESTTAAGTVSQFGVSTIQTAQTGGHCVWPFPASDLTERGIALLPLAALVKGAEAAQGPPLPLQNLQLLLKTESREGSGFKLVCNLLWKGPITEEVVQSLEAQSAHLTWETLGAWKAIGESQD
jgi:hypothetical protein